MPPPNALLTHGWRIAANRRSIQEVGARACGELDSVRGNECLLSFGARPASLSQSSNPYLVPETKRLIPGPPGITRTGTAAALGGDANRPPVDGPLAEWPRAEVKSDENAFATMHDDFVERPRRSP